jgi:hypothetical protein
VQAYLWKQFAMAKIRLREPPEIDFEPETPQTVNDLVSLHVNDMGYSLADLGHSKAAGMTMDNVVNLHG